MSIYDVPDEQLGKAIKMDQTARLKDVIVDALSRQILTYTSDILFVHLADETRNMDDAVTKLRDIRQMATVIAEIVR